jgi:predicted nucleic acid-binding protein
MTLKNAPRRVVMLDACVLINILATGRAEEILGMTEEAFAICSLVRREAIFLRPDDPKQPMEAISLDSLIETGCLEVCEPTGAAEQILCLDYATDLDDGEAMSLALAQARGFVLATDDRKARRLFSKQNSEPSRLLSTAGILRIWSERKGIPRESLKATLSKVTARARFVPAPQDTDYKWWLDHCNG